MIQLFDFFPTNNLKIDSYFLWSLYFIFIFLFLITLSTLFLKNKNNTILFSLFIQLLWICFFYLYLYFEKKNSKCIFYESLPNDNSIIRNSIQSFIDKASTLNPFILPYDTNSTYVYFTYNFQQILLKTSVSKHYSQLEEDIDKILKNYPYVPLAIIKDDNLISLMNIPLINLKKGINENTTSIPME